MGALLAARLGGPFLEGDDYHPAANRAKMASGCPLDDADRFPWLRSLGVAAGERAREAGVSVVACSALARRYRKALLDAAGVCGASSEERGQGDRGSEEGGREELVLDCGTIEESPPHYAPAHTVPSVSPLCAVIVDLNPSVSDLSLRVEQRQLSGAHFMPASLLTSQLQTREPISPEEEREAKNRGVKLIVRFDADPFPPPAEIAEDIFGDIRALWPQSA